ncbi:hypothetical protein H1P_550014 [Hyella patelloides LEGE 07179]|uniref:Uncharacterized protein n=1 Tax=Hyella patelloides LEGE 07179 TaxID=945734 RepID=A0A563W0P4_9CYAN|nr:hypothetical protein [Hyella patelloides]VEP17103.1 hypothetical protein H1P_550014 [Hyella patelloides LEGE 07179]
MTLILERTTATDNKFGNMCNKLEMMIEDVKTDIPYDCLTSYDLDEYAEQYSVDNREGRLEDLETRVSDLEP